MFGPGGGGRQPSAPFCVCMRLKRRVSAAHGCVERPKPIASQFISYTVFRVTSVFSLNVKKTPPMSNKLKRKEK